MALSYFIQNKNIVKNWSKLTYFKFEAELLATSYIFSLDTTLTKIRRTLIIDFIAPLFDSLRYFHL